MSGLLSTVLFVLVFVVLYQIGKASDYAATIRGEAESRKQANKALAILMCITFIFGMIGIWACHNYFKDMLLPISASESGREYDKMYSVTIVVTGIVFFITQTLLFWFTYKYQASENRTAFFFAHSNQLEALWTTVPALAMAVLVAIGLKNWFTVTSVAPPNAAVVEVVGKQFNWIIRYPGKDNELGKRDFRKIDDANNVLGMDWTDPHNADDIISQSGELHLIVGKPVKLLIGSRDVIHDVGLSHFRLKMDAVPGITTTMWFTPTITTDSMKRLTHNADLVYEISCDQMCGKGHYSMRGTVIVETETEYNKWMASQKAYYVANATPAAPTEPTKPAVLPTDSTHKAPGITKN